MKKFFASVLVAFFLVGCDWFSKKPDANTVLQKMHKEYSEELLEKLEELEMPDKAEGETKFFGSIDASSLGFNGKGKLDFTISQKNDMPDDKNYKSELNFNFFADGEAELAPGQPPQKMGGNIELNAKLNKDAVFFNIGKFNLNTPMLPLAMNLQDQVLKKWYTISFEKLNELLKSAGTEDMPEEFDIDFTKIYQPPKKVLNDVKKELKKLITEAHFWEITSELKEKNGFYEISVESDTEKMKNNLKNVLNVLEVTQGANQQAFAFIKEEVNKQIDNFDQNIKIKGTLVSDESYDFVSFKGGFFLQDKKLYNLEINNHKIFSFKITTVEGPINILVLWEYKKDGFIFSYEESSLNKEGKQEKIISKLEKKGENLIGIFEGEKVFEGKYNKKLFSGTIFMNEEQFANFELKKEKGKVWEGGINVPSLNLEIAINKLKIISKDLFNGELALDSVINLNGKKVGTFGFDSIYKENSNLKVEIPKNPASYEEIIKDIPILGSLYGEQEEYQDMSPPEDPITPDVPKTNNSKILETKDDKPKINDAKKDIKNTEIPKLPGEDKKDIKNTEIPKLPGEDKKDIKNTEIPKLPGEDKKDQSKIKPKRKISKPIPSKANNLNKEPSEIEVPVK